MDPVAILGIKGITYFLADYPTVLDEFWVRQCRGLFKKYECMVFYGLSYYDELSLDKKQKQANKQKHVS